jgi:hypothetical protein
LLGIAIFRRDIVLGNFPGTNFALVGIQMNLQLIASWILAGVFAILLLVRRYLARGFSLATAG